MCRKRTSGLYGNWNKEFRNAGLQRRLRIPQTYCSVTWCAPTATPEQLQPIIDLANQILVAKQYHPQADTSALETAIDELDYQLYGLTEDEISVIGG